MSSSIYMFNSLKFSRIYLIVKEGNLPTDADQNIVWEKIKKDYYGIEDNNESLWWENIEEEQEEKTEWFQGWNDIKNWTNQDSIAIDAHY